MIAQILVLERVTVTWVHADATILIPLLIVLKVLLFVLIYIKAYNTLLIGTEKRDQPRPDPGSFFYFTSNPVKGTDLSNKMIYIQISNSSSLFEDHSKRRLRIGDELPQYA